MVQGRTLKNRMFDYLNIFLMSCLIVLCDY